MLHRSQDGWVDVVRESSVDRSIASTIAGHYGRRLKLYGPTHRAAGWSTRESQELRFATLLDGIDWSAKPSLLDYGCGCGALAGHLDRLGIACRYVGYDIAPAMSDAARAVHGEREDRRFTSDPDELDRTDHVVASGIFNVKLELCRGAWARHVGATIAHLGSLTGRRLAFNMLPAGPAPELERDDLYYANPAAVIRYCEAMVDGTVALREGYGPWDFTVIVRRDEA